jgi:dipeptidyl aminopeptidase/acylaminoacyl peptidase
VSNVTDRNEDIWIVEVSSANEPINLTPWSDTVEGSPDWSPDGISILFESDRESAQGNVNIWVIKADGTQPQQLTTGDHNYYDARYSPSGQQIAFVSDSQSNRGLWLMDADGQNARPILSIDLIINSPAWSPDGTRIAFAGCRSSCELYTVSVDGTELTQVSTGDNWVFNPEWTTTGIMVSTYVDGRRIIARVPPGGDQDDAVLVTDPLTGADHGPRNVSDGNTVFYRVGGVDSSNANIWMTATNGLESQITDFSQFSDGTGSTPPPSPPPAPPTPPSGGGGSSGGGSSGGGGGSFGWLSLAVFTVFWLGYSPVSRRAPVSRTQAFQQ